MKSFWFWRILNVVCLIGVICSVAYDMHRLNDVLTITNWLALLWLFRFAPDLVIDLIEGIKKGLPLWNINFSKDQTE